MSIVLIMSYSADTHALHVIKKAVSCGIETILFDVSSFPTSVQVAINAYGVKRRMDFWLDIDGKRIWADQITGVWARRTGRMEPKRKYSMQEYIIRESEVVVRSLNQLIPRANWISDPEMTRLANRKPIQLRVAQEVGFHIPATCITNSPKAAQTFVETMADRPLTMKPVGTAFIQLSGDQDMTNPRNKVVFTRVVEREVILANLSLVENCPIILQEAIQKDSDIRVTVVDENVFASEILLEGCADPTNLDWRNYEGKRVYRRHELPDAIQGFCRDVVQKLGLRFGCIDLGYSRTGGYTFFEINPQGQWLPSEEQLGYNIAGALLEALLRPR